MKPSRKKPHRPMLTWVCVFQCLAIRYNLAKPLIVGGGDCGPHCAEVGETKSDAFSFKSSLKVDFQDSPVTSDDGLVLCGSRTNPWASESLLSVTWPAHEERIASYFWPTCRGNRYIAG